MFFTLNNKNINRIYNIEMSFKHSLYINNQLDVNTNATILETLAVGQSNISNSSAVLELVSTSKGLLFPRMTTTQRNNIINPATGLVVYDITKNALYHYNGLSWVIMIRNLLDNSNIIIGDNNSGDGLTSGAFGNIIIGRDCANVYNASNGTFIGENVLGISTNSADSVIIGANSGNIMDNGSIKNTSCGESCFLNLTTGTRNTAIGNASGGLISTGINNTMLGSNTNGSAALNNQTAIGYQATTNKSNQIMIGNSSVIEMVPNASATVNLGTVTNKWSNLYISGDVFSTNGEFNTVNILNLNNKVVKTILNVTTASTANYSITITDVVIMSTYSTTGSQTLTLPLISSSETGKTYYIIDNGGNALNNHITITTSGADMINGDTNVLMDSNYQSISIYNTGSSWYIF